MSRFNTGNPLGSNDPRDLDDNAKNMDLAVNSEDSQWIDRFGRPRLPLMEQERQFVASQESREAVFSDFLQASGYQDLGEYAPGIEITAHNQYVTFGGQPYLLKPSIPVPYTTSGAWTGDEFKLIGDDTLRQELALPGGSSVIGYKGITVAQALERAAPDFGAVVRVGSGEEFSTINSALEHLSKYRPAYKNKGMLFEIRLASGFVMREQVYANTGIDLGFVWISSDDSEVSVDSSVITDPMPGGIVSVEDGLFYPFGAALFGATNGSTLPVINTIFRFSPTSNTAIVGLRAAYGSKALVRRNAGILDAPAEAATAIHGSLIEAAGANFSGAGSNGISSYRGSAFDFRDGIADNAGLRGAYVGSNSRLEALHASFKNAGSHGIEAYGGSIAHVRGSDFSGAGGHGIYSRDGSVVSTRDAVLDNCAQDGIRTLNGGKVYAEYSSIKGVGGNGVFAHQGGYVTLRGSEIDGTGAAGVLANEGATVSANEIAVLNAGTDALFANNGSTISAPNCQINNTGRDSVYAGSASNVSVSNGNIGGSGRYTIEANGSVIAANGVTISANGAGTQSVRAVNAGTVNFNAGVVQGSPSKALHAMGASTINAGGSVLPSTSQSTVTADMGSTINLHGSSIDEPVSGSAIECINGSTINATSTGAATLSKIANNITANGVIYRF